MSVLNSYEETSIKAESIIQLTSMAYVPANVFAEKHRKLWPAGTFVIPEFAFAFQCDSDVVLSYEHSGFKWLHYDEAIERLTWDSNKTALYELNCRLIAQ